MDTNFSQSLTDHAGLGLDGEDDCDELRQRGGCKKKRLSVQQVRSLEMNFEMENKLEPERKMQIAQELGLQPRQVAIWFQNRRARWKTKQLEREYGLLKLNYESLKSNFDVVQRENQKLSAQVSSLKERLEETQEQKADDNGQGSEAKPMQKKANNNNANKANGIEMCESEGSSGILNDQCEMNRRNSPSPINSYVTGYNNNSVVPASHEDFKAKASVTQQNCYENQNVNHQNLLHHEEQPSCNLFNMVDNPAAFTFPWWEWS